MTEKQGDFSGKIIYHEGPSYRRDPIARLFTFYPVIPLLIKSYVRQLTHSDLWKLRRPQSAEESHELLKKNWLEEIRLNPKNPSLLMALVRSFRLNFILGCFYFLCYIGLNFTIPLIMPYIIVYIASPEIPSYYGYVYVAVVWVSGFASITLFNMAAITGWSLGIRIRAALMTMIYRKVLVITPGSSETRGEILNLMSTDAQFFLDTIVLFLFGFCSFFQIIAAVSLMSQKIDEYSLISILVLFLAIPSIAYTSKFLPIARNKSQQAADVRVKLTEEFISAIRIIKYYAWEEPFLKNLNQAREIEISSLLEIAKIRAILMTTLQNLPTIATGATILFYSIGNDVTLESIFPVVSYLGSLRVSYIFLPLFFTFGTQYLVFLGRIRRFILIPEITESELDLDDEKRGGMYLKDASFSWSFSDSKKAVIKKVNVDIPKGKLHIVVGSVGSGKSSLAMAFLGELNKIEGEVSVSSRIAYVSQEPFIVNNTIRENICFGQSYDPLWYQKVINSCALVRDLEMFPAGDMTEVAEKGSNLSGGQRQRLNVARAMYSRRELYIFDDPFSAVDSHVGEHMFNNVIIYLRQEGKTVLLITNQLQFVYFGDYIYQMHSGEVVEHGTFSELIKLRGRFYQLTEDYGLNTDAIIESSGDIDVSSTVKKNIHAKAVEDTVDLKLINLTPEEIELRDKENLIKGQLIRKENTAKGIISARVFACYFNAASYYILALIFIVNLIRTGFNVSENIWLSRWADPRTNRQFSKPIYSGSYAALVIGEILCTTTFCFIQIIFTINGSRNIHKLLVKNVSFATTGFFDFTPIGRLMSRFSKDINFVDTLLPWQFEISVNILTGLLSTAANMVVSGGWAVLIILVGLLFYFIFLNIYRYTSTQIQRLEATSRAPIFTHFSETLDGVETIRAYQMSNVFRVSNLGKVDSNSIDYLALRRLAHWFNYMSNQMMNFFVAMIFLMVVLVRNYSPDQLALGLLSSSLSNSISILGVLGAFGFNYIDFETRLNAVERILDYDNLPQESAYRIPDTQPADNWPEKGEVSIKDLVISYKPSNPVLKDINVYIKSQEKVGIVGRTGAGKSTLITAFFRTVEPEGGVILIDGVDISTLGLFELRSKLSIIPQVPKLFLGTLRYNLDPFNQYGDEDLWKALDMVSLGNIIRGLPGGLVEPVQENGSNFSVGQRQLISMARCLLRNTYILLLDEATASLDVESDSLLQKMLREHFLSKTVLTIAHRLITIIDNDRVMVLEAGKIIEFDKPSILLDKKGAFWSMVQATGPATSRYLEDIAYGRRRLIDVVSEAPETLEESDIQKIESALIQSVSSSD